MLDLWSLRALRVIADQGSLSRAATLLEVSQSTLSRRLAELEVAIGGRLFYRNGRGVILSELGRLVRPRADALATDIEGLLGIAREQKTSPAGEVDIGLVRAAGRPLPSRLVERLARDYPRIRLRFHQAYSGQIEEALGNGRIDIGVFNRYTRGKVRGGELLFTTDMVAVRARRAGAPKRNEMQFAALADLPLVVSLRPNPLTATLEDIAARQGITLRLLHEAASADILRDIVKHAGCASVMPRHVALADYGSADFEIAKLTKPAIAQTTWLALTTQRPPSQATRVVARLIKEICVALMRERRWIGPTPPARSDG